MNLYDKYILPKVTHWACSAGPVMKQRQKIVPHARGRVLEIGIGSGRNLALYDQEKVIHLWGLDPAREMWDLAADEIEKSGVQVEFLQASAESIPLEANQVDSVVMTYTMCTIPDVSSALSEIKRVLKPSGQLYFCEHGLAPDLSVRKWQDRLNPIWKKLGGGCHLNRDIPSLLRSNGIHLLDLKSMYIPGWKIACFNYWGTAKAK